MKRNKHKIMWESIKIKVEIKQGCNKNDIGIKIQLKYNDHKKQ